MLSVLLCSAFCAQFQLKQVLWPKSVNEEGLFGRAVAFSQNRIVVGASQLVIEGREHHEDNRTGCLYPYDYDPATDQYIASKGNDPDEFRVLPSEDQTGKIIPGNFGSKLAISGDGKTVVVGAPYTDVAIDYRDDFTIPDEEEEEKVEDDIITYSGSEQKYYSELGAIYVYKIDEDGNWTETYISVPKTVVYKGGYGRAVAATSDVSSFAGSYYNKIPNKNPEGIPLKVGKVFVETKNENDEYVQSAAIDPPETIFNNRTQRFGSTLNFFEQSTLFVTSLAKNISGPTDDPSGIFVHKKQTDGSWKLEGNITANGSDQYPQFGLFAAIRDDSLVAIYGSKTIALGPDNKPVKGENAIFILSADESGNWKSEPQQVIQLAEDKPLGDTGMFFCSASTGDKKYNFLALLFDEHVEIWEQDYSTKEYKLFQRIDDPKSIREEHKDTPYDQQGIIFGSDFSWDQETCTKFVLAGMSKADDGNVPSWKYGRVYVFSLTDDKPDNNDKAIIIGCSVAAVVVVIVVVVVVVVLIRKRRYTQGAAELA